MAASPRVGSAEYEAYRRAEQARRTAQHKAIYDAKWNDAKKSLGLSDADKKYWESPSSNRGGKILRAYQDLTNKRTQAHWTAERKAYAGAPANFILGLTKAALAAGYGNILGTAAGFGGVAGDGMTGISAGSSAGSSISPEVMSTLKAIGQNVLEYPQYYGAAIGGGTSAARGGDIGQIIQGAGYGYTAGSALGAGMSAAGAYGGAPAVGTVGPQQGGWGSAFDSLYGSASASFGPSSTVGKIFNAVGTANSLMGAAANMRARRQQRIGDSSPNAAEAPQFYPKRPDALSRPASLNELGAFSPEQERSYLATRGKNTGLGSEEDQYYNNLVQRSLIGEGNKVDTSNPNFLMPIESSYYSGQGRNTSDVMEFLRSLQA